MGFQNGEYVKIKYLIYDEEMNLEGDFEVGEVVQLWDVDSWNTMAMIMKNGKRYFISLLQIEKIK